MTSTTRPRTPYYQNMGTGADPERPRPNYVMLAGLVVMIGIGLYLALICVGIALRDYPRMFHMPTASFSDSAHTPRPSF